MVRCFAKIMAPKRRQGPVVIIGKAYPGLTGRCLMQHAINIIDTSLVPVKIEICLRVPDSIEVPGNVP